MAKPSLVFGPIFSFRQRPRVLGWDMLTMGCLFLDPSDLLSLIFTICFLICFFLTLADIFYYFHLYKPHLSDSCMSDTKKEHDGEGI